MKENKNVWAALVIGLCAIACVVFISFSFINYKRTADSKGFTATGSASCDFEADLIVWRGSFSASAPTSAAAYSAIKDDSEKIKKFLMDSGVAEDEMIFSSVSIWQDSQAQYNDYGNYIGEIKGDYVLSQNVEVTSTDVEKIEKVSRDISAVIESGVQFNSYMPEYYYTKLDELKLQLIDEATANAKHRIEIMSQETGCKLGDLLTANLGVFQITAQNSASEEYSYGGTFNTSSKNKTATITVKLNYAVGH